MTEQEAIETLQDMRDVAECRIKSGDNRGVIYIPEDKLDSFDMAIKALKEIQQYRAIGTPDECQATVEKQIPKKPNKCIGFTKSLFVCPTCGRKQKIMYEQHYCKECGQKLDWSDAE